MTDVSPQLIRSLIDRTEYDLMRSSSPPGEPDEFERWLEYRNALRRQLRRHYDAMLEALTTEHER